MNDNLVKTSEVISGIGVSLVTFLGTYINVKGSGGGSRLIVILFVVGVLGGCGDGESNNIPIIDVLNIPNTVDVDSSVIFSVIAHDVDGDILTYIWIVDGVPLRNSMSTVSWKATKAGIVTIKVTVSDGKSSPVIQEKKLTISPKSPIVGTWKLVRYVEDGIIMTASIETYMIYLIFGTDGKVTVRSWDVDGEAEKESLNYVVSDSTLTISYDNSVEIRTVDIIYNLVKTGLTIIETSDDGEIVWYEVYEKQ